VEIALSKMLSSKAPAIDKVTSDMIKAAGLIRMTANTEIWKYTIRLEERNNHPDT
jgi:hypothetical protein